MVSAEILKHWQVPVYASVASQCALANKLLADGETLTITNFPSIQALAIPGHTLDHTTYHFSDVVFTGDTLFTAGCGRIFEGTAEMMLGSLQKLAALPNNTRIYCGHEYTEKIYSLRVLLSQAILLFRQD